MAGVEHPTHQHITGQHAEGAFVRGSDIGDATPTPPTGWISTVASMAEISPRPCAMLALHVGELEMRHGPRWQVGRGESGDKGYD